MRGVGITYLWASKEFPPFVRLDGKRGDYEVYVPERTCHNVHEYRDSNGVIHRDARIFKCSECGFKVNDFYGDDEQSFPRYCPNCGRKVI